MESTNNKKTAMANTWLTSFLMDNRSKTTAAGLKSPNPHLLAAFWKHHPLADQSAKTLVAATLAFQRATGGRLIKLTPAGDYQAAGRGGHAQWCGDPLGRRTILIRAINSPESWLNLADTLTSMERDMVAAARSLRQALPADIPLLATVFPPLTQALMLAGPGPLLAHLESAPDAVLAGLARLTVSTRLLIAAYQEAGVNGIYLAVQHLSEAILPRRLYRRFGRDSDTCVMMACGGFEGNILHIHGVGIHFDGLPSTGPWLIHYELGANTPSPADYLAVCRFPAVIGLPFEVWGHPDKLKTTIRSYLADFGQHTALLTGPCVVPLAIPDAHIAAWIQGVGHAG